MRRFSWAALVLAACGASQDYSSSADGGWWWADADTDQCFSSNECPTGWTCNEFGACEPPPIMGPDAAPPAEVEREFSAPSSALRYVYVTMTDLDALAKIDGASLAVTSVPVGDQPEIVAAVPGTDDAVVLDRGSATATIVRPTVDRDEKVTLRTTPGVNSLSMPPAPSRYAVAWLDLTAAIAEAGGVPEVGDISSQDVTVMALSRGEEMANDLSVGFRPREVEFDATGERAFVITDDGVSVIDLAAAAAGEAHVAAAIPVAADPLSDPSFIEVDITATGEYAIVRETGRVELRVVRVLGPSAGEAWTIPLPAEATDVDLTSDGSRAFAVLRSSSQLAVIDMPADAVDPSGLELIDLGGEIVGSAAIDSAASRAILYTNASDEERVTIVDLVTPGYPHVVRPLQKGIRALAFAPDGQTALILHNKRPGDPATATSVDELIDRSYGYSLLDLDSGFAKLEPTPVDPGAFAFALDSSHAYLCLDGGDADGAVARLEVMNLSTFVVDEIALGSPPEAVGVLPSAGMVYVSQRHPLGRVTFVDLETAGTRTVTGFELNSHILD